MSSKMYNKVQESSLTLGNEKVEHGEDDRMAAEHVVAASTYALDGHSAALPDVERLVDALHPTSVRLKENR